jgi:hypothetical protein
MVNPTRKNEPGTATGTFIHPLQQGRPVPTSPFGMRTHPVTGERKLHQGQDYAYDGGEPNTIGKPISAVDGGIVTYAGPTPKGNGGGNVVTIDHGNGVVTRYLHMDKINVQVGQKLRQGDIIGTVGNTGIGTGAHLHWEARIGKSLGISNGLGGMTTGTRPVNPVPLVGQNYTDRMTIREGDFGGLVEQMKSDMRRLGYNPSQGDRFTAQDKAEVQRMQKDLGLTPTGAYDSSTRLKVREALQRQIPVNPTPTNVPPSTPTNQIAPKSASEAFRLAVNEYIRNAPDLKPETVKAALQAGRNAALAFDPNTTQEQLLGWGRDFMQALPKIADQLGKPLDIAPVAPTPTQNLEGR